MPSKSGIWNLLSLNKSHKFTQYIAVIILVVCPLFITGEEPAEDAWSSSIADYPFQPGEKLTYSLHWSFIKVGKVTMETSGPEEQDGEPCLHFHLSAKTSGIVDAIYRVRTDIHGWADARMSRTRHYIKKQNEGKTHRDIVVDYDWPKHQLIYSNLVGGRYASHVGVEHLVPHLELRFPYAYQRRDGFPLHIR